MGVQIGAGKALKPGTYRKLGYAVQIGPNGAIAVRHGDWLSKYSMAIHGNPWRVHQYGHRDEGTGAIQVITNVGLIHAGETIYHIPSVNEVRVVGVPRLDPPKPDQRRLLVDFVKRTKHLSAEQGEMFTSISGTIGFVDNVAALLGVADDLVKLPGLVGTVGTMTGAVGIVLMPVGFMYEIANAVGAGPRKFKKEAMAAAVAAWAFDKPKPPVPATSLGFVKEYKGEPELPRYRKAWKEGVDQIYAEMPKHAIRRAKSQILLPGEKAPDLVLRHKLLLRAIAKNDPRTLRDMVLKHLKKKE
jgi:hypothetical protein